MRFLKYTLLAGGVLLAAQSQAAVLPSVAKIAIVAPAPMAGTRLSAQGGKKSSAISSGGAVVTAGALGLIAGAIILAADDGHHDSVSP